MKIANKDIVIIGTGPWARALALAIYEKKVYNITLLSRKKIEDAQQKIHTQNPNWPQSIKIETQYTKALATNPSIIIATPSKAIINILKKIHSYQQTSPILCASKGLTQDTSIQMPHQAYSLIFGNNNDNFAYLSGPTFAQELLEKAPSGAVIAANKKNYLHWSTILTNNYFHTTCSTDLTAICWCSIIKNIIALIAGCLQGCKFKANSKALFLQKAIIELYNIIKLDNANANEAFSLAGLGDIILSASNKQSRNFNLGYNIAKKSTNTIDQTIESINNIPLALSFLTQKNIPSSIVQLANNIVLNPKNCKNYLNIWFTNL